MMSLNISFYPSRTSSGKRDSASILQRVAFSAAIPAAETELVDIYGPVPLPSSHLPLIATIIAAIAALLLILFFFYWFKKRKQSVRQSPVKHDIIALQHLDQAAAELLPGHCVEFADKLSEIIRQYIEARFTISSTRQTTAEFLLMLTAPGDDRFAPLRHQKKQLRDLLTMCDMAKFAKKQPETRLLEQITSDARSFIHQTASRREQT